MLTSATVTVKRKFPQENFSPPPLINSNWSINHKYFTTRLFWLHIIIFTPHFLETVDNEDGRTHIFTWMLTMLMKSVMEISSECVKYFLLRRRMTLRHISLRLGPAGAGLGLLHSWNTALTFLTYFHRSHTTHTRPATPLTASWAGSRHPTYLKIFQNILKTVYCQRGASERAGVGQRGVVLVVLTRNGFLSVKMNYFPTKI